MGEDVVVKVQGQFLDFAKSRGVVLPLTQSVCGASSLLVCELLDFLGCYPDSAARPVLVMQMAEDNCDVILGQCVPVFRDFANHVLGGTGVCSVVDLDGGDIEPEVDPDQKHMVLITRRNASVKRHFESHTSWLHRVVLVGPLPLPTLDGECVAVNIDESPFKLET